MEWLKEAITLALLFPIIVVVGLYFSWRLKLVQLLKLKEAFSRLNGGKTKGGLSSFGAMAAILGGNLGTGNISGVAVAISTGGPGALFWMWVMAILAATTKYVGCFLGVHFQEQNKKGEWVGGPMFYLKQGLKSKWLAYLFCFFTVSSALSVGNLVQVHALSLPLRELDLNPLPFSLILAVLVGGVIFGNLKQFSRVVSFLVPLMAVAYIGTCALILFYFRHRLGYYVEIIFTSAFSLTPMAGGFAGFSVLSAIRAGFDRGLFATDCGLGLAPILHSAVRDESSDNRVTQALISVLSPMIVMVVCSMTGLVLLSTQAYLETDLPSTTMCMEAFRIGFQSPYAGQIVSITLFFFAFTTILTWSFCANRAVEFMGNESLVKPFKWLFVLLIPLGVYVGDKNIWLVADFSTNFMFLVNMIGVIGLRKIVFKNNKL